MKVFLTGAGGFLGGHILAELRAAGCEVMALSRRPESDSSIAALGGRPVRGDLTDLASLPPLLEGCEAVFHVAADTSMWRRHVAQQTRNNVDGTRHLLRAAESAGVGAFLHTSSVAVYSHLVSGVLDESSPRRGGESWINYEATKHASEDLVRGSALPWIIFQPSHVLGPGDRRNWARLILLIDQEKLPGIPPGAGCFADVREIARAQVRAWQRRRFGEAYVLGGVEATFQEVVARVGEALHKRTPRRPMPAWLLKAIARAADVVSQVTGKEPDMTPEAAAFTCQVLRVNSAKAARELDYVQPPLDLMLADMLAWMRAENLIRS